MRKNIARILIVLSLLGRVWVIKSAAADQQQCRSFGSGGYFFDNYEQHEYINNLLVLHFKLQNHFNDGRTWGNGIYLLRPDCSSEFVQLFLPGFKPRPKMQFFSIRFSSPTHFDFWDDEQLTKFDCTGACGADLPEKLSDNTAYSSIGYTAFIDGSASTLTSDSFPIVQPAPQKTPTLIVPGVLGSELQLSGKTIWPNLQAMLLDPNSNFMDPLDMDINGKPVNPGVSAANVLSRIDYAFGAFDYTTGLINEFSQAGYSLNKDLFTFPYDWRLSVEDNAAQLKTAVDKILTQTGAQKINIVAHSLGGLVVKQYLFDSQQQNIDKVVFVGVPNLGSAEAAEQLIFGSNLNIALLSGAEMQKLAQNMPGVYQLLPGQEYFKHSTGFYDDLFNQRIKTILDYGQSKNLLLALGKNQNLIAAAENLHNKLDNFNFSSKAAQIFNLVGCGQFTLQTINKMYAAGPGILQQILYGPKYRIFGGNGDGTVLTASAEFLSGASNFFVSNQEHGKMLSADGPRQFIVSAITGADLGNSQVFSDAGQCAKVQGQLLSLNSSLDINVTDPVSNKPLDLSQLKQFRTGGDLHVFLPTNAGQKYKVVAKPAAGSKQPVDISITKIDNIQATIYNYNQINISNTIEVAIEPNVASLENVDNQGNAQAVQPTETLDQSQLDSQNTAAPADPVLPVITNPTPVFLPQSLSLPWPVLPLLQPSALQNQVYGGQTNPQAQAQAPAVQESANSEPDSNIQSQSDDQTPDNDGQEAVAQPVPSNININLQLPAQPESQNLSESVAADSSDLPTAANRPETIFIVSGNSDSSYWSLIKNLFHLIFF